MVDKCRGCESADVFWAVMAQSGSRVLVEKDGAEHVGNLVIEGRDARTGVPVVRVLRKGDVVPEGTLRFRVHFMTCPAASKYRKSRGSNRGRRAG